MHFTCSPFQDDGGVKGGMRNTSKQQKVANVRTGPPAWPADPADPPEGAPATGESKFSPSRISVLSLGIETDCKAAIRDAHGDIWFKKRKEEKGQIGPQKSDQISITLKTEPSQKEPVVQARTLQHDLQNVLLLSFTHASGWDFRPTPTKMEQTDCSTLDKPCFHLLENKN